MSAATVPPPAGDKGKGPLATFLRVIERTGNALPHPATLFLIFAVLVIGLSGLAKAWGWTAIDPRDQSTIEPVSLMTIEGLHRILRGLVTNFTGFAPLGTVLVALLGIGVAESSGLISAAMRWVVARTPRVALTPTIVFVGIMSNIASELGYVLLVPLAATIYQAAGRNPILGMAAAFAGVSGGYSANLALGTVDPLLSGITQEAGRFITPDLDISPACNYYFMVASTFLITVLGTFVTEKIVAPRLGDRPADRSDAASADLGKLETKEKSGLVAALVVFAAFSAVLLAGTLPEDGFLRENGNLLKSPFLDGIVAIIFAYGVLMGLAYGFVAGTIKSDNDVMRGMAKSMETLGGYLVLVFFAAQFTAFFNWTKLGLIFGVNGAEFLKDLGLSGVPLLLLFILLTAFVNLVMGSASAKWALMAPIFIPMFMILKEDPAVVQCAFRIGDSCTNIISPMMSYFALIMAFMQRYDRNAGLGTLVATMLPYSFIFLIGWGAFFAIWISLGIPIGPGSS